MLVSTTVYQKVICTMEIEDRRLRIWIAILNTRARVGLFEKRHLSESHMG